MKKSILISLIIPIILISGCARTKEPEKFTKLTFSVVPFIPEYEILQKYQPLADYLSDELGVDVNVMTFRTYKEVTTALGTGEIDLAYYGPASYLETKDIYPDIEIIVGGKTQKGLAIYYSCIITNPDSGITSVEDIKGRSFAFGSPGSTSGYYIPLLELKNAGIRKDDLSDYRNYRNNEEVARAVISGEKDAGGIIDSVYGKYKDELVLLKKSDPLPTLPWVLRAGVSAEDKERIIVTFTNLNPNNPAHKEILEGIKEAEGGFTRVQDSNYEIIHEAMMAVREH